MRAGPTLALAVALALSSCTRDTSLPAPDPSGTPGVQLAAIGQVPVLPPMGPADTEEPVGRADAVEPEGRVEAGEPEGRADASEPEGRVEAGEPEGRVEGMAPGEAAPTYDQGEQEAATTEEEPAPPPAEAPAGAAAPVEAEQQPAATVEPARRELRPPISLGAKDDDGDRCSYTITLELGAGADAAQAAQVVRQRLHGWNVEGLQVNGSPDRSSVTATLGGRPGTAEEAARRLSVTDLVSIHRVVDAGFGGRGLRREINQYKMLYPDRAALMRLVTDVEGGSYLIAQDPELLLTFADQMLGLWPGHLVAVAPYVHLGDSVEAGWRTWVLAEPAAVAQGEMASAKGEVDAGRPTVRVSMTPAGAARIAGDRSLTGRLALLVGRRAVIVPEAQMEGNGGELVLGLGTTSAGDADDVAEQIAAAINAGPMPAVVRGVSVATVSCEGL